MMYLLASKQLVLSLSSAHHSDSWAAVFLWCTYFHVSSSSYPSLPRTTVTAGQLFFYVVLTCISAASPVPVCPAPRWQLGSCFYDVLTCISAASPVPVCRAPQWQLGSCFLLCPYLHLSSFSCPSLSRTTVTAGQLFFYVVLTCIWAASPVWVCPAPRWQLGSCYYVYLLASQQLLLSQSPAHHGDSWAAVFMMYLLASQQLLLSQSPAHHGDSWTAVFYDVLTCISAASPVRVCRAPRWQLGRCFHHLPACYTALCWSYWITKL